MGSESSDEKKLSSREVFPPEMARWIEKQYPSFDALHAGGDETEFKNNAYAEFVKEFGEKCDGIPECKKVSLDSLTTPLVDS
jgi:hypothetical protein